MATKKRAAPAPEPSEQEIEEAVRELVQRASGLAGSEFKKELNTRYKKFDKSILHAAERLAANGDIHRWSSAKKVRFFSSDPHEILPRAVRDALQEGPLTEAELAQRLKSQYRGLADLSKEWLKRATTRGEIFQHPPVAGSKTKRYSKEPNLAGLLKKVIDELKKLLSSPVGQHVTKERALEVIAREIGFAAPQMSDSSESQRQVFLRLLSEFAREQPPGALLSVRELRGRVELDKNLFDSMALELSREGIVTLHHHDFPESLPDSERSQLIVDGHGTHYVGIALRSAS